MMPLTMCMTTCRSASETALHSSPPTADPFRPTAGLRPVLLERARQLASVA